MKPSRFSADANAGDYAFIHFGVEFPRLHPQPFGALFGSQHGVKVEGGAICYPYMGDGPTINSQNFFALAGHANEGLGGFGDPSALCFSNDQHFQPIGELAVILSRQLLALFMSPGSQADIDAFTAFFDPVFPLCFHVFHNSCVIITH
jgi:hypothetical protein